MNALNTIEELFVSKGSTRYGENVTQLEHALQTAQLAIADNYDDEFVVACFLHDFGHLLYAEGLAARGIDGEHEEVGANWLADYFPTSVTEPIRLHVAAKQYLCAIDDSYYDTLSDASKHSLKLQGGVYNQTQAKEFETRSGYEKAVQLRKYDDCGKIIGLETPSLQEMLSVTGGVINPS
jgi:phosphonate degradation associated HDIG domain protein